jgi:hypothetical protein
MGFGFKNSPSAVQACPGLGCAVVPTATKVIRATKATCTKEFEGVEAIPLVVAVEAVAVEAVDEVVMVRAGIEVVKVHDEVQAARAVIVVAARVSIFLELFFFEKFIENSQFFENFSINSINSIKTRR